jgi:hypothetical protein
MSDGKMSTITDFNSGRVREGFNELKREGSTKHVRGGARVDKPI